MAEHPRARADGLANGLRMQGSKLTCRSGDMQLTKAEIAETQIIVTTPEKWDVVTRKPTGEGELASVRLQSQHNRALNVDYPHLL